jgi:hypothetical protein
MLRPCSSLLPSERIGFGSIPRISGKNHINSIRKEFEKSME